MSTGKTSIKPSPRLKRKPHEGMVEGVTFANRIVNIIVGLFIALVAFCSVVPMWHVLMSSLSDGFKLFSSEGLVIAPAGGVNLGGYKLVFQDSAILRSYLVTILYVVGNCAVGVVLNASAGYVLSQESKLKGVFIGLLMFSIMFGGGLIPSYMVNRALGLVGNPLSVILPSCTNAMFMIMMMNAYLQVPQATVEAARIDGANHLQIMFQVMLPQARGMVLVTIINTALGAWNDWFSASIYLVQKREWWPLQLVIKELTAKNQDFLLYANPDYNRYLIQYVAIIIATLPILIALPFFIRKLEDNMVLGAVKG